MRFGSFVTSLAILSGPMASASPADVPVRLDLGKTRAPISGYVYGQFIEHLGRCIYGGIWAEMLEDRKFYYPVDGEAPGAAAALHEMFRNSDLFFMANYAQTVNVIGAIKTTATAAEMETTGLGQQLYRARFGTTPVEVAGELQPLDVAAALTEDGRDRTAQRDPLFALVKVAAHYHFRMVSECLGNV